MRSRKSLPAAIPAAVAAVMLTFGVGVVQGAEPLKIRFAWVVAPAELQPFMFAKQGIAKHLGKSYVLDPIHFAGTSPMITGLATGELDIALLAYSSFALAIQNAGMNDLRIIADEFQDGVPGYNTNIFMVRKDSPIKTVEDLKGKVLASNVAGSAVDIAMRAMLRKQHLDEKKDVTIIEAGFSTMRAMLAEHKVDFVTTPLPFSEDSELLKIARPLFTQKQAVGQTQMIIQVARVGFLKKNHAAVVDFMEDTLRAYRWFLDPKNHKEAVAIAANFVKQPASHFDSWLFTKRDYYRDPNGLPNLKALQQNIETQRQLGFLKADINATKLSDLSIVKEAAKRLE